MLSFGAIAGWLAVAVWSYLLSAHGRFWSIRVAQFIPAPLQPRPRDQRPPRIVAVIPARNEASVIERGVRSLLQQRGNDLHIFVVDDNSTDGTAEAAQTAANSNHVGAPHSSPAVGERVGVSERVTVIAGRPLPAGWSGKLWAVQQGVEQALRLHPDYLLLTDADIEHAPDGVNTLVDLAERGGYDLVSFMVKLHCRSVAEKLLIPPFVFFFFLLYPPEWVRDPRHRTAGAAGGCMLLRPAALERIGGLAAIRTEIIDDCALARAVKRSGGKVWLGAAAETHSLRRYNSFAGIERMIVRTAFNQLRHSVWLLLGTVLGMLLLFVLPIALMVSGSPLLAFAGAFAYGLMTFVYLPMVRDYGLNPLWTLTLPVAAVFYAWATIHSAVKYWLARGGEWKGRAQDVA